MNVKQFTRILAVIGRLSLVSFLLLVLSASGVMAGPFLSASASEWQPYEPTGEMVVPATDKWVSAVEKKDGYAYILTGDGYLYTYDVSDLSTQQSFTATIYLPLIIVSPIPVSSVLTPFDANLNDLGGPSSWSGNYGKTPEIIVSSNGVELDVLAQDYDSETAWNAVLLHIEPDSTGYGITQALADIPNAGSGDGFGNR